MHKNVKIKSLLLILFLFLTRHSLSQELFPKEMKWEFSYYNPRNVFEDTTQIIQSHEKFGHCFNKPDSISNSKLFIVRQYNNSTASYYQNIFIYANINSSWIMITNETFKKSLPIQIEVNKVREKIIFRIGAITINELPFEKLESYIDRMEYLIQQVK